MRAERQKKFIERLNHHTTSEADRVIQEVPQAVQKIVTAELDKRFGPAPQGAKEEALVQRAAANKILRELRKQEKKQSDVASACAEVAGQPAKRQRLDRISSSLPASLLAPFRDAAGKAIFEGKLGTKAAADFSFFRGRVGNETLRWLQSDPTFPRNAEEMKSKFFWERGTENAKKLSAAETKKLQVMAHTGTGKGVRQCNGLPVFAPLPDRLGASTRAFKIVNAEALDCLAGMLQENLSKLSDEQLGSNGRHVRE